MNGKEFADTLKLCGLHPSRDSSQSFEWMFDCEPLLPFFEWFVHELQPSNVLSTAELKEFDALLADENSGYVMLDGAQLTEALDTWSVIDNTHETASLSTTEDDIGTLHDHLDSMMLYKDHLQSLSQKLLACRSEVGEKLKQLEMVAEDADLDLKQSVEHTQADAAQLNKSLESIVPPVCQLLDSSSPLSTHWVPTCLQDFVSALNMDTYHTSEEYFTQHLVNFTKKKFFEGIAEIAGYVDGDDYSLVEVSNPDLLLIKGAPEDSVSNTCKELTYNQLFYPSVESRWINALVELHSLQAACAAKEAIVKHGKNLMDLSALRANLKSAEVALSIVTRDMLHLTDVCIPGKVKEASSLQVVQVLRGDYDLKIARQDYFICNQDQVIRELIIQRSRSEFVSMTLEIESRWHHQLHKLLIAIHQLLQQQHSAFTQKMKMMSDLEKKSSRLDHSTVDSSDKFVHSTRQLLDCENHVTSQPLFVTFEEVERKVQHLLSWTASSAVSLDLESRWLDDSLRLLKEELESCLTTMASDRNVESSLPSLSPWPISDAMTQLNSLLNRLEQVIKEIISGVDSKKKILQKDSLLKTEREIFPYFFNAPAHLRQLVSQV